MRFPGGMLTMWTSICKTVICPFGTAFPSYTPSYIGTSRAFIVAIAVRWPKRFSKKGLFGVAITFSGMIENPLP
jgi:hypothetical protein